MDDLRRIERHRDIWRSKPVLRAVYQDYFDRIRRALVSGDTLEIGGGSGNLREVLPVAVSIDIQWAPWLSAVADAQELPFRERSFANVIMLDVFHHLPQPTRFLSEAMRVLRDGGRLVMVEPNISLVSWLAFKLTHEEPVIMGEDPFASSPRAVSSPYDSNQAIPYSAFIRHAARLADVMPAMEVLSVERFALWAYPLSGGFQPWSLLPMAAVKPLLQLENRLERWLGALAGFRLMVVAERRP